MLGGHWRNSDVANENVTVSLERDVRDDLRHLKNYPWCLQDHSCQ